jgi:hypothetical protein
MNSKFVPCGEYMPDQADYGALGTNSVVNAIPRTKRSYSPMPSFARIATTPLNGAPLGASSTRDLSGNPGMYVGTTTKLYAATSSTKPNFTDASGAATFATAQGGFWDFVSFNGQMLATNGTDPIQTATAATAGPFAVLNANAPKAKVISAVQPGFVICGNINDPTVGLQPQGVRWGVLGDQTSWPLIGSAAAIAGQSDWQAVQGNHGSLQAIAPNLATCNAALFFERAIFRMVYTGDSKIFAILPAEKFRGTLAPRSVVQVGQTCYYLGQDGFYGFDGTQSIPIGVDKVNKTFLADCDPNYLSAVQGVVDPLSGLCFWLYAGPGNNNGAPNRVLCYHSVLQMWALITGFTGYALFIGASFGTSLDGIDALGYNIDTLPYSLDSPLLAGGRIVLASFDTSNYFGSFSGPNMAYSVETTEAQLIAGGRARVSEIRPITEGAASSAALGTRNNSSDGVSYSPAAAPVAGVCPARGDARYHRAVLSAAAGSSVQHILGAELAFTPGGRR